MIGPVLTVNTKNQIVWNQCAIYPGEFQNAMGLGTGGIQWGTFWGGPGPMNGVPPMLGPDNANRWNFSVPLFYYFGLRPGQTSYHTFIRLYIDEELADSVL